jgi:hypothetical protein
VPVGETWLVQTNPAVGGRSYVFDGTAWLENPADDYHFRIVTAGETIGINELTFERAVQLYPNPAQSVTNLVYNFDEVADLTMTMTNSMGQIVQQRNIDNAISGVLELDLNNLAVGVYIIQLTDGTNYMSKKLVVNK